MAETVEATYEGGVLRLDHPLREFGEQARVQVTVEATKTARHPLADCIGIMPAEDADELTRIIREEFEKVDPRDWE